VGFSVFTIAVVMHPSTWYLWSLLVLPLAASRRWRSLVLMAGAMAASIATATVLNGWYNTLLVPLLVLKHALFQANLIAPNLVGELQPSGGAYASLVVVALFLIVRCLRGTDPRTEIFQVDFCLMLLAWIMGLFVLRFWIDWGVPAMAVWMSRQIRDGLDLKPSGLTRHRDTIALVAVAAGIFYLGLTANLYGRYTHVLNNALLMKPVADFAADLPEDGGILYSADMRVFYSLYFRLPHAKFRYSTGFEPGIMPPDDLKVLRAIQSSDGAVPAYKPWFDKMTGKDRVFLSAAAKPSWPKMEFKEFYGFWMARKIAR